MASNKPDFEICMSFCLPAGLWPYFALEGHSLVSDHVYMGPRCGPLAGKKSWASMNHAFGQYCKMFALLLRLQIFPCNLRRCITYFFIPGKQCFVYDGFTHPLLQVSLL